MLFLLCLPFIALLVFAIVTECRKPSDRPSKLHFRRTRRAAVYLFGYPQQDWPPGRGALRAWDAHHRE